MTPCALVEPHRRRIAPAERHRVLRLFCWSRAAKPVGTVLLLATTVIAHSAPRERLPLADGWRFHRGDPAGVPPGLAYDIRPEVKDRRDDRPADAEPTAPEGAGQPAAAPVLKPWILPAANPFIAAPARQHPQPTAPPPFEHLPCTLPGYDDTGWIPVRVPHDWAIAGPFHQGWGEGVGGGMGRLPSPGVAWYRRALDIPGSDAGRRIVLEIEGAMSYALVWCNGRLAGGWPYGYASWQADLTPLLVPGGTNQIAIRLDNPPDSARWYPGGGLYRNVWLVKTEPVHVGQWGIFLTTPEVSRERATVNVRVTVENTTTTPLEVTVATDLFPWPTRGEPARHPVAQVAPTNLVLSADTRAEVFGETFLSRPRLWGPPPTQQPNLYLAVTTITHKGRTLDRCATRFGIREVRWGADQGVRVNGERIRLQGVNLHHDLGALGAAWNRSAARRQLERLRDLGVNALRTAHNPPASGFLELADEMGFLVINEIFDSWERKKTPLDFHLIFPEWSEPDLRAFLRRDRNHPSVVLWSVGNEVGEQYTATEGARVARRLVQITREEDPTRPVTAAMNYAKPDMPFPAEFDVISLNYQGEGIRDTPAHAHLTGIRTPPQYAAFRAAFPDKVILSSESAATLSSRGTYLFPVHNGISAPVRDGQGGDPQRQWVSAYELYAADFGSAPDKVFAAQDRHPFVAGEFVWSGWDYLGEPTPYYGARSSYFGIVDLAGFPKDRYYLYQSRWRPELPQAHLLPHWTWPGREGQVTPVHVFTSGDEAELFLNGRSLGRKRKGPFEYRLRWDDAVYEPGTLRVITYRNGRRWAVAEQITAGPATRIQLMPEQTNLRANGDDLWFVAARVTDTAGRIAPHAEHRLHFSVTGPAEIVATDNGDPTDFDPFPSASRRAFNGLCLAIVRPTAPGRITLTARADGLATAHVSLRARPAGP
ncbi:MAG: beta-galactosidase GalB [Limisphaerales bacterium]|jgi:beta-galactosidase